MDCLSPAWRARFLAARGLGRLACGRVLKQALLACGRVLTLAVVVLLLEVPELGPVQLGVGPSPVPSAGPSAGASGWSARPSLAAAAWAAAWPAAAASAIPQEPLLSQSPGTARALIPAEGHYRCDGEALTTVFQPGAVDAVDLPNQSAGTLPGSFLLVRWRGIQLQLPRTNDAGPPRFSDGKWLWQVNPGEPPRFRLRQGLGEVKEFACEAVADRLAQALKAERADRS